MIDSFKQRLNRRSALYGIMLSELYVPNLARLLAKCGYDYLLIDCEHGYFDMTEVASIIAVADGCDLPVVVRVRGVDRAVIAKYLDMGATGILLSDVAGAQEARELVNICCYAPRGDRGLSTFRAHTGYQKGSLEETMRRANESVVVICQIESPGAVRDAAQILAVDGMDGVLIGPNDLTQRLGLAGQYDHPQVLSALQQVAKAAADAGKWSGIITANHGLLSTCADLGMSCFSLGSELSALYNAASSELRQVKKLMVKEV